jgi:hypothetical protein
MGTLEIAFVANNDTKSVVVISSSNGVDWSGNVPTGGAAGELGEVGSAGLGSRVVLAWGIDNLAPMGGSVICAESPSVGVFSGQAVLTNGARGGPSLSAFHGKMYCAYRTNSGVEVRSSGDGLNWSAPVHVQTPNNIYSPALAVHQDRLYLAYEGTSLMVTSSHDGVSWSNPVSVHGESTKGSPAMASFGGRLRIAFVAANNTNTLLVCSSSDGVVWTANTPVDGRTSRTSPSLAVFNGKLFLAYTANNPTNTLLVASSPDGESWFHDTTLGDSVHVYHDDPGDLFATLSLSVRE